MSKMKDVDPGSGLDDALNELFAAVYKYREYVKRHHRDRLAGVMWIRKGNELIAYSENARYTEQVCRLTWDSRGDSFSVEELRGEA